MKTIITGGAGFIGSNAASRYLRRGHHVVVIDSLAREGARKNLEWLRPQGSLEFFALDIRKGDELAMVFREHRDADQVLHLAAQVAVTTSVSSPREDFEINAYGTFNVLEAMRLAGMNAPILYSSTNKVYGEMTDIAAVEKNGRYTYQSLPLGVPEQRNLDFHSPYGCSKGGADQYVRDFARIYKLPAVVFRMSCIAGPRQFGTEDQGWVAHFIYSALQRQPIVVFGDGRQVRDVLCIHDLIRAFESVRRNISVTAGQIYNVGGGMANTVSLLELIDRIEALTGHRLEYMLDECRPGDQPIYVTNYAKLHAHTGWQPEIDVSQTIMLLQTFWEANRELVAQHPLVAIEAFDLAGEIGGRAA